MKVAVLGARGFIGSYLCTYLRAMNYEVLPVLRETLDLTNYSEVDKWLTQHTPDVVINAAIVGGGTKVQDRNYEDFKNNLAVFFNFYHSIKSFRYINIGSGAEFDKSKSLDNVQESMILQQCPADTYGLSKNIISRYVLQKPQFMTLRLFGCFANTEPSFRLFKKFLSGQINWLQDRYFDYFSLADFAKVVEYFCRVESDIKDLNCVYQEKYKLSEILSKLKNYRNLAIPIYTDGQLHHSYTGSSSLLDSLQKQQEFPRLEGIEKGLKKYE